MSTPLPSTPGEVLHALSGKLDVGTAAERKERLHALLVPQCSICLDLKEIASIDTWGIQLLLALAREAKVLSGKVRAIHANAEVLERATLCGLRTSEGEIIL